MPTISAAVDASTNWQKSRSDAALPAISGNAESAPAVAGGIVVISATMNRNIGTTIASGCATRPQASAASARPEKSISHVE